MATRYGIYLFGGIGACYTNPQRDFNKSDASFFNSNDPAVAGVYADFTSDPRHVALVTPMGLGVRYDFNQSTTLFVEGSYRQGFDDKIDGFSASVNSPANDGYSYFSLGCTFRLIRPKYFFGLAPR
jgi:hypothetical protein